MLELGLDDIRPLNFRHGALGLEAAERIEDARRSAGHSKEGVGEEEGQVASWTRARLSGS